MVKPTVLQVVERTSYWTYNYEALRRIITCFMFGDYIKFNIYDMVVADKIADLIGRKRLSVQCKKQVRSILEEKRIKEIGGNRIQNLRIHKYFSSLAPEEIFELAFQDKDCLEFLTSTYSEVYKDMDVIEYNYNLLTSYSLILNYCSIVDELNNTDLYTEIENLIQDLRQENLYKSEVLKRIKEHINKFLGVD